MMKVEHYAMIAAIGTSILVGLTVFLKVAWKVRSMLHRHNPAMMTIDTMDGLSFEKYIASLLRTRGYTNLQLTEEYDYGVDIIADKNGIRWGIQVKRYSGLVKAEAVRQVVTALKIYHCDQAMVITNSTFSRVATELADSNDCLLIDRGALLSWIVS